MLLGRWSVTVLYHYQLNKWKSFCLGNSRMHNKHSSLSNSPSDCLSAFYWRYLGFLFCLQYAWYLSVPCGTSTSLTASWLFLFCCSFYFLNGLQARMLVPFAHMHRAHESFWACPLSPLRTVGCLYATIELITLSSETRLLYDWHSRAAQ